MKISENLLNPSPSATVILQKRVWGDIQSWAVCKHLSWDKVIQLALGYKNDTPLNQMFGTVLWLSHCCKSYSHTHHLSPANLSQREVTTERWSFSYHNIIWLTYDMLYCPCLYLFLSMPPLLYSSCIDSMVSYQILILFEYKPHNTEYDILSNAQSWHQMLARIKYCLI